MQFPSSLREGVHRLEDAIITLSGPGIAVSGIIAGVDLLTGGHAMSSMPWLTVSWAICLLLSLDFQVLALGARAQRVYLSNKPTGRKVAEILLALAIAAAISFVSIQMQSIVAKMNASNMTIDQATMALGLDPNALIFERAILVLALIFLSGWFRHEDASAAVNQPMHQAVMSQLEEWFMLSVQMHQGMLNQFITEAKDELLIRLVQMDQAAQDQLNQVRQGMVHRLAQNAQINQDGNQQLEQRLLTALDQQFSQLNQQPTTLRLDQAQMSSLAQELARGQQRQFEAVFSQWQQVTVREDRAARQTDGQLTAISAPVQPGELPVATGVSEEGARVLSYLNQCKLAQVEPSLTQIESECQVTHNTAIAWRRKWREMQTALVGAER